ncbi:hypothetical protein BJV82DRAFT_671999 [Fennellomyces sp. T-0311]|nr:hypothetical protein BJV82DRAFT_671995 [Fennellomyces sp. T-0311]KAI8140233.1 hypothetical protein BJV82DRAFT_671999 [Fennellomyces sp. T-0311]
MPRIKVTSQKKGKTVKTSISVKESASCRYHPYQQGCHHARQYHVHVHHHYHYNYHEHHEHHYHHHRSHHDRREVSCLNRHRSNSCRKRGRSSSRNSNNNNDNNDNSDNNSGKTGTHTTTTNPSSNFVATTTPTISTHSSRETERFFAMKSRAERAKYDVLR